MNFEEIYGCFFKQKVLRSGYETKEIDWIEKMHASVKGGGVNKMRWEESDCIHAVCVKKELVPTQSNVWNVTGGFTKGVVASGVASPKKVGVQKVFCCW